MGFLGAYNVWSILQGHVETEAVKDAFAEAALVLDIPIMIATAVACLPIFFTGHRIARWEGALFFLYYPAYMTYLILDATEHSTSAGFGLVMTGFVMPLTVVTLVVCSNAAMVRPSLEKPECAQLRVRAHRHRLRSSQTACVPPYEGRRPPARPRGIH